MCNIYNAYNKKMLASNATDDGDVFRVKKDENEIKKADKYLCPIDIEAVMVLLDLISGIGDELLGDKEEVEVVRTSYNGNVFEGMYYADGSCDVLDAETRECYYAFDQKEGGYKVSIWNDFDDEMTYVVHDPNMFSAAEKRCKEIIDKII